MTIPSPVARQVAPRLRERRVLADLVPGALVRDVAFVVGAAGFVGLLSQVVIHLPFTPVPITGQTLGVVLAGCALGWRRAAASMLLYLVVGLIGVPWFAGHASGWPGVLAGYVVGFIAAAAICGWLAERGTDRTVLGAVPTMIAGEVVLYAIAVPWLAISAHLSLGRALALGCTPFLAGDAVKLACAAGLLPATWKIVGRQSPRA